MTSTFYPALRMAAVRSHITEGGPTPRCIDCGEPAWDTRAFLCRWCERWRVLDIRAARVG